MQKACGVSQDLSLPMEVTTTVEKTPPKTKQNKTPPKTKQNNKNHHHQKKKKQNKTKNQNNNKKQNTPKTKHRSQCFIVGRER